MEEGKDMHEHKHYTCPMHPEEMQDHPGQCSVCGMDLVPVEEAEEGEM